MARDSRFWLFTTAGTLALLIAPVVLAVAVQPESSTFSGFLLNPVDGHSYLAKMRQGADGNWLFVLPYAENPGSGAFLFVFYLGLGHLQALLGWSPLLVYHLARLAAAVVMFWIAWIFLGEAVPTPRARRWAYGLILVGSGLGWIGLPLGRLAVDLWVPEAIPFLSGLTNPHFPLASAGVLLGILALISSGWGLRSRLAAAAAAGVLLGMVQPFAILSVGAVGLAWTIWDRLGSRAGPDPSGRQRSNALVLGGLLGASLPWILYAVWVTQSHAALASWSAQNQTPTPPAVDIALGLGLVLPLATWGALQRKAPSTSTGRMVVVWAVVGLSLVFAPLSLQRRLLLGVYFPMAALAGTALERLTTQPRMTRLLPYLLLSLTLPSNVLLVVAATTAAARQDPEIVLSRAEVTSYAWVDQNLEPGALILAGDVTGNRLPAYADVRVVYGHPFETPDASNALDWVQGFFPGPGSPEEALLRLRVRGVDYVYLGPRERSEGPVDWSQGLPAVYNSGGITILSLTAP